MLKTLLESSGKKERNQAITAASATVHGVLIIVAAFATAAGAPAPDEPDEPSTIVWTRPPKPAEHRVNVRPVRLPPAPRAVPASLANVAVSIDVPSVLPDVNATPGAITKADFQQTDGVGSTSNDTAAAGGLSPGRRAYTSNEVEVPVGALRGGQPEYPASLRASGVEGEVVALFVVDESGRAVRESVRILSATNDLFAATVKVSIPRMRFTAARIGSRAVPQLVQQLFVFRLDR